MFVKFERENRPVAINPGHVVTVSPDSNTGGQTVIALVTGMNIIVKGDFETVLSWLKREED